MFQMVQITLLFTGGTMAVPQYVVMALLGLVNTYWALILPAVGGSLGLFLMKQFMRGIPDSMLEAAKIDGANELTIFWRLVMPNVKPAWLTLIVYCFQDLWNKGASIYIHSEQLKSLNYAIQQITAGGIKRAGASAASTVIMMVVPILVFVISQSNIIETMGSSGMKD